VPELKNCNLYFQDSPNYLVEYRGDFKGEMERVQYACGDAITDTIAVISTSPQYLNQLLKDVPSIIFIDPRSKYVLQDISPSSVDNINAIKINPYLDLNGSGVLVGMVDTGIDYLNEEFIREDDTSKIVSLWDQTIPDTSDKSVYIGKTFSREEINNAIKAYRSNQDPYAIVPSKDEIGHGTQMSGIIGARGFNQDVQGVASGCEFVIVKLLESINFKNQLQANGLPYTPIYNAAEIVAGVEYLKNFALKENKPMVIYLGIGTSEGSHDGNNLISRYLTSIGRIRGIVTVTGVGNEGASDGHASGIILQVGGISTVELKISKDMKYFSFGIWVLKPNIASINIISPNGESSGFIKAKNNSGDSFNFVFYKARMTVNYYVPEQFTGHELINVNFSDIKTGIWTIELRGEYITNGRYDIWLPPQQTLPKDTKFLQTDQYITVTLPSFSRKAVNVAYHGPGNALVASSGRGFSVNDMIRNPDIATLGTDILTTKVSGGVATVSGSSAATAIVAGACALLLQWGIVNGNDTTMSSVKVVAYLIHGADRSNQIYRYPNQEIGYGFFDLLGTFNIISRSYRQYRSIDLEDNSIKYYVNNLFIRIPK